MTPEEQESWTPVDRPLMRSDLNDMRKKVFEIGDRTIAIHNEFRGVRSQLRTYVAICIASAFFSVVAAVVSVVTTARAELPSHRVP